MEYSSTKFQSIKGLPLITIQLRPPKEWIRNQISAQLNLDMLRHYFQADNFQVSKKKKEVTKKINKN